MALFLTVVSIIIAPFTIPLMLAWRADLGEGVILDAEAMIVKMCYRYPRANRRTTPAPLAVPPRATRRTTPVPPAVPTPCRPRITTVPTPPC